MQKNTFYRFNFINFLFIMFFSMMSPIVKIYSQKRNKENYEYLSPLPGAVLVHPETNIIIREGDLIDPSTLENRYLEIDGSKSGIHNGRLILSDDGKTIIFKPDIPFYLDENVIVSIHQGIKNIDGELTWRNMILRLVYSRT